MKLPTYFISHGGGPWPWLKKEMPYFDILEAFLKDIPKQIGVTPRAVLVISGHWEAKEFRVMGSAHPGMVYDYGGFPAHTYNIKYHAPGSPAVAQEVLNLIQAAGLPVAIDDKRGFDHGTFVPLYAMYPNAEVPVLQLSLMAGYDPQTHVALGRALAPLREKGVLIVGSGLSYHNLRAMWDPEAPRVPSQQFDEWLKETLLGATADQRIKRLSEWAKAPSARQAHPREDHLVPLMVAVGAAEQEKAERVHHEKFMGTVTVSSYKFG